MPTKSGRPVDSQKSKMYKAEDTAASIYPPTRGKDLPTVHDIEAFIRKVQADPRFVAYAPQTAGARAEIHNGGGALSASARIKHWGFPTHRSFQLVMPVWSRYEQVALHELAHIVAHELGGGKAAFHGREFAEHYLWLVRTFIGVKAHDALRAQFQGNGVRFRPKREMTPAQREAAARGLAAMAAKAAKEIAAATVVEL